MTRLSYMDIGQEEFLNFDDEESSFYCDLLIFKTLLKLEVALIWGLGVFFCFAS